MDTYVVYIWVYTYLFLLHPLRASIDELIKLNK